MIDLYRKKRLRKTWKNKNYILWFVPITLVVLSCFLIASTQRQINDMYWYLHSLTAVLGLFLSVLFAQLPLQYIRKILIPLYLLMVISLIAVSTFGTSALGAQRWLSIGGINIQPSEIAKLVSILVLAGILDRHKVQSPNDLLRPLSIIFIPWVLVFIQPDLGTSLVFGAVLLTMLYWSGMPLEWVLLALSLIVTSILSGTFPLILFFWIPLNGFLAYRSFPLKKIFFSLTIFIHTIIGFCTPWLWNYALKGYQRDRLILFLDPAKDPLGGGYHLIQSKIGIGSGGILGTGLLQGELTKLRFIPEQHTDFIFSALGEETGFLGTLIVITSLFLLMIRLIKIARLSRTDFESLVVIGIATMFMFQVVVNIFMTIGLGPVTGIPLPFMSYGRTALLINFISLGLCLSVARRSQLSMKNS